MAEDKWNERGGLEEGRKSAGHSSGAAEAAEVARQAEREV